MLDNQIRKIPHVDSKVDQGHASCFILEEAAHFSDQAKKYAPQRAPERKLFLARTL
jgi:hypothetical protein